MGWLSPFSLARSSLPFYGWVGLAVVAGAEILLWTKTEPIYTFFTPTVWTGYILWADSVVRSRKRASLLSTRRAEAIFMAVWSIVVWLVFEAYNLRLKNWYYVGLPLHRFWEITGYLWAFATILPAILETEELLEVCKLCVDVPVRPVRVTRVQRRSYFATGGALLLLPLVVPERLARYLFGLVWIGFIFLCEPILYELKAPGILSDWEQGQAARHCRLLLAGALCGFLWEFWNFWAGAKWHYTLPPPFDRGPRIFEMPWLGFLGFLPFGVECFCLYQFGWTLWSRLQKSLLFPSEKGRLATLPPKNGAPKEPRH